MGRGDHSLFGVAVRAVWLALIALPIPALAASGPEGAWIVKLSNESLGGLPILGDLFNALGAVDTEAVWLITREGDGYIVRIPHRDFRLAAVTEGQRLYGEFQERDDDPDDDEAPGKDIVDVTFDGDTFSGMLTLANGTRFPVQATRFQIGGGMQEQLAALVERLAVSERRADGLQAKIDARPELPPGVTAENLAALQAQVADLMNENLRVQAELDNPPIDQAAAEAQARRVAEAAVLQSEVERINLLNQQLGVEVALLRNDLAAARAAPQTQPAAMDGLEAELGRLRQEISAANAQVVDLSGENQALLTEKALTAERAAQLGSQLSQAQAQAAEAEARRTAGQQTLDQAQAQVENRVGEVITLQAEIAAANENRGNQQGRILTLEAEIATANAEREKQVGQVLTLQAEIATVNAESVQRTREFEALRAEAAPLVDLNARLTAEADVLRRDLNQVNGLTLQAQAEQNRAQGELVQARSELDAANQQVALLTEQNSRIQLDLFDRSQETEAMALDINRLNARSAELAAENSFFQSRSRPISLDLFEPNIAASAVTIRQSPSDGEIFGTVQTGGTIWVLGTWPGFPWALVATKDPSIVGFGLTAEVFRLAR